LFKVGTHDVVAVPDCPIHHPLINRVAALLAESLQATSTSVYSERAHSGLVRYLQVVVERSSQTAQVVVVVNSAQDTACLRLFEHLHERLGSEGHSVFFNGQPARTNAILGPHWRKHSGPDAVVETFGGAAVCYPPGAFGQSNLGLFVRIVSEIHSAVEPDAPVVELFAGVGAIGLGLARRGHSVLFNEVSPASLEGLRLGIHELPALAQTRVRCVSGEAASAVAGLEFSGAHVIVDPPRKGLGEEVLQSLLRGRPDRLTYLSCGLQSFLDDAESLVAHGFVCDRVTAYALFPFTDHVETLAQFRHARR
jgi:23S rRNA (uracil1939-C5)-methyltransferase